MQNHATISMNSKSSNVGVTISDELIQSTAREFLKIIKAPSPASQRAEGPSVSLQSETNEPQAVKKLKLADGSSGFFYNTAM